MRQMTTLSKVFLLLAMFAVAGLVYLLGDEKVIREAYEWWYKNQLWGI